jgi:hypothetical protein
MGDVVVDGATILEWIFKKSVGMRELCYSGTRLGTH